MPHRDRADAIHTHTYTHAQFLSLSLKSWSSCFCHSSTASAPNVTQYLSWLSHFYFTFPNDIQTLKWTHGHKSSLQYVCAAVSVVIYIVNGHNAQKRRVKVWGPILNTSFLSCFGTTVITWHFPALHRKEWILHKWPKKCFKLDKDRKPGWQHVNICSVHSFPSVCAAPLWGKDNWALFPPRESVHFSLSTRYCAQ